MLPRWPNLLFVFLSLFLPFLFHVNGCLLSQSSIILIKKSKQLLLYQVQSLSCLSCQLKNVQLVLYKRASSVYTLQIWYGLLDSILDNNDTMSFIEFLALQFSSIASNIYCSICCWYLCNVFAVLSCCIKFLTPIGCDGFVYPKFSTS